MIEAFAETAAAVEASGAEAAGIEAVGSGALESAFPDCFDAGEGAATEGMIGKEAGPEAGSSFPSCFSSETQNASEKPGGKSSFTETDEGNTPQNGGESIEPPSSWTGEIPEGERPMEPVDAKQLPGFEDHLPEILNAAGQDTSENGETGADADGQSDRSSPTEGMSVEEKQDVADAAAQEYNERYHPAERAHQKGYDDVKETPNGGVSFEDSDALYRDENGNKGIVSIEATGNRTADFNEANKKMGLSETPDGYVWHHMDDYDVGTNKITLQLVKDEAHNATKPHSGGCAQYDAVHGESYNRKVI